MKQQQQKQHVAATTTVAGTTTNWKFMFVYGLIVGILISNIGDVVVNNWTNNDSISNDNNGNDNINSITAKDKEAAAAVATTSTTKLLLLDNNNNNVNNNNIKFHPASQQQQQQQQQKQPQKQIQIQKPAKCGVVFFYHNGDTGGSSFDNYLKSYVDSGYPYYTIWGEKPKVKANFIAGTTKHIQNLATTSPPPEPVSSSEGGNNFTTAATTTNYKGWKTIHSHHMSGGMNDTIEYIQQWKYDVEQVQGCKFLLVTIARDPLDHFLAKFRYYKEEENSGTTRKSEKKDKKEGKEFDVTKEEYMNNIIRKQQYLEYFMYNWIRNGGGVYDSDVPYIEYPNTTEKVIRALEIVDTYYDIIVMDSNVTKLEYAVGEWTGWTKHPSIRRNNSGTDKISFTKNQIKQIRYILDKDGDTEFYRQLKLRQASDDYPNVI